MNSYREWYSCDNFISDSFPWLERDGNPATGAGWLAVLNPSGNQTAHVRVSFYFEHPTQVPKHHDLVVAPHQVEFLEFHRFPDVPRNQFVGLGVTSDIPVVPQSTILEFRPWDLHPDATISKVMYPGPLTETEWYFPDGWQGGGPGSQMSWYERETLTLLNPGPDEAQVTLTLFSLARPSEGSGNEVPRRLSCNDPADVVIWVPPHRLKSVSLYDIPGLRFRWIEESQTQMIDFSVRVRSNIPIVPQKTRRAYVQYEQSVQGMWSSFGHPYPLEAKKSQQHAEWYYPGGFVQDVGNYPPNDQDMLGWNLFFTFNPDPDQTSRCKATFFYESDQPQRLEFDVAPHQQTLYWLHHEEHRHLTGTNRPYAVQVESDGPLVPHFLCAEYESWSWHNPTAMSGIVPYEGPLTNETDWYYAEGFWQDQEDHPWIEHEWIGIFNPGRNDADVSISFLLGDETSQFHTVVKAGRVGVVRVEELGLVPSGSHFGVKVVGSQPIVVQQTRRTFKKGGSRSTLSTTATLAMPFKN